MADVDVLKQLVDQLVRDNVAAREDAKIERDEAKEERDEANRRHEELLAEMARQRIAAPAEAAASPGL